MASPASWDARSLAESDGAASATEGEGEGEGRGGSVEKLPSSPRPAVAAGDGVTPGPEATGGKGEEGGTVMPVETGVGVALGAGDDPHAVNSASASSMPVRTADLLNVFINISYYGTRSGPGRIDRAGRRCELIVRTDVPSTTRAPTS